ncbi:hypothetical protein CEXT_532111 [Caerostris extrusa]|uniref:Uncharacterized protein n=1 Tax=Caerostris extrusa TaxID=172846 RepID=A0AAV4PZQ7_CAEEX|nr:hypothetical protein CEXT_532111 [Caerostris extrusa]
MFLEEDGIHINICQNLIILESIIQRLYIIVLRNCYFCWVKSNYFRENFYLIENRKTKQSEVRDFTDPLDTKIQKGRNLVYMANRDHATTAHKLAQDLGL